MPCKAHLPDSSLQRPRNTEVTGAVFSLLRVRKDSLFFRYPSLFRVHLSRLKADHTWGCTPCPFFPLPGLSRSYSHTGLDRDQVLFWVEVWKKTPLNSTAVPWGTCSYAVRAPLLHSLIPWWRWAMWAGKFLLGHIFLPELHMPWTLWAICERFVLMGEVQICNYFVPVERTEPPHTYSNSWLWECWEALPASFWASGSYCCSSRCCQCLAAWTDVAYQRWGWHKLVSTVSHLRALQLPGWPHCWSAPMLALVPQLRSAEGLCQCSYSGNRKAEFCWLTWKAVRGHTQM